MRKAGPWFQGSVILPATSMLWPTMPWCIGNAPVPIVAWICAVLVGDEPTVASVYHVPFGISDLVNGQAFGCASSTLMPPASHTSVTTSFGRSRPDSGSSASVIGRPSGAWNPSNFNRSAVVGAMPADVTGRATSPCACTKPGPYQSMGTVWM